MANGELILLDRRQLSARLLDAQSLTSTGIWVEARFYPLKAIKADAIETGATIAIHGSNDESQPGTADTGVILATLTPSTLAMTDNHPWRWIKAHKIQGGSPAVSTVIMEAAPQR